MSTALPSGPATKKTVTWADPLHLGPTRVYNNAAAAGDGNRPVRDGVTKPLADGQRAKVLMDTVIASVFNDAHARGPEFRAKLPATDESLRAMLDGSQYDAPTLTYYTGKHLEQLKTLEHSDPMRLIRAASMPVAPDISNHIASLMYTPAASDIAPAAAVAAAQRTSREALRTYANRQYAELFGAKAATLTMEMTPEHARLKRVITAEISRQLTELQAAPEVATIDHAAVATPATEAAAVPAAVAAAPVVERSLAQFVSAYVVKHLRDANEFILNGAFDPVHARATIYDEGRKLSDALQSIASIVPLAQDLDLWRVAGNDTQKSAVLTLNQYIKAVAAEMNDALNGAQFSPFERHTGPRMIPSRERVHVATQTSADDVAGDSRQHIPATEQPARPPKQPVAPPTTQPRADQAESSADGARRARRSEGDDRPFPAMPSVTERLPPDVESLLANVANSRFVTPSRPVDHLVTPRVDRRTPPASVPPVTAATASEITPLPDGQATAPRLRPITYPPFKLKKEPERSKLQRMLDSGTRTLRTAASILTLKPLRKKLSGNKA